ncbi:MAG: DUF523 and DUF1722 domain-containing protein [Candidatus Thiodiazotropha endolucinida]|nr:DUF523 and DUF1722 domain-containing protein [Candidatus Thiodiazotropha taylori]MCG8062900.1 DUF523 and DUF1722 domain-containing protein [Candidatus Thiodiazotropha taylori]MCW4328978.1 DUF523 and DUF1722 domain-containing protein [Candidatus Thiodiazotropha endolucinida]MCW4344406.1 DUF523 and DUF1722 domain-containing protein [Candidatus Thiodiazotropha endolucinida]
MSETSLYAERPAIGVSACLLGHNVRYDGGHKRDRYIVEKLGKHMELLPICPEAAIGLGVPRPTIHLVGDIQQPRLVGVSDPNLDVTDKMKQFALKQVRELNHISGYILKKNSPSCGMERVKVYTETGQQCIRKGTGVFARVLMQQHPLLPIEEEGRLNDSVLKENFVNRVYVCHRWRKLQSTQMTPASLIAFHTEHKYLVMAHSQAAYQRLGKLVSNLPKKRLTKITDDYIQELMNTLKRRVTRKRHVNVLQHIMGYLKQHISRDDKAELTASIESYRRGETPLIVPITLLRHYFRHHPDSYMSKQVYLQPHPDSLGLRNSI